ncbi:hypothetical protein [Luteimonas sp. MC1750]|nr:hypothetical protein [Luteimonas sp. MC1750]
MSIYDRILNSQEHSFIALRSAAPVVLALIGLAVLTATILPSIVA